jgi:hypothetical protein
MPNFTKKYMCVCVCIYMERESNEALEEKM